MYSINHATIVGNITAQPELKYTPNGKEILNITVATNHSYKKGEEWIDVPSFHRIVLWGNVAKFVAEGTQKGDKIYVDGRIDYRTYEDKEGVTRYVTEIKADRVVLLGGRVHKKESEPEQETTVDDFPDKEPSSEKLDQSVDPDDIPF
ncbi:MAG: Plasmid-derived single-stranded DNA-binding protein [Candidatus Omnitrophica bacterium]|nr:Plasmid-derived single-stranded DNA-binding protein [Candidatus Omnitrophota bacterium]